MELNENENITNQYLWDTAKVMLKGKFVALSAYIRKEEKFQTNNLSSHLKTRNKEE